jgi:hypothetical protein
VIEELDEKKKETLKVTWLKVNKYESFDDSLHISADSVSLYILLKMSLKRSTPHQHHISSRSGPNPIG